MLFAFFSYHLNFDCILTPAPNKFRGIRPTFPDGQKSIQNQFKVYHSLPSLAIYVLLPSAIYEHSFIYLFNVQWWNTELLPVSQALVFTTWSNLCHQQGLSLLFLPSLQIVYDGDEHNGTTMVHIAHHKVFFSTLYFLYIDQLLYKNEGFSNRLNYGNFVFNGNSQHLCQLKWFYNYPYCALSDTQILWNIARYSIERRDNWYILPSSQTDF